MLSWASSFVTSWFSCNSFSEFYFILVFVGPLPDMKLSKSSPSPPPFWDLASLSAFSSLDLKTSAVNYRMLFSRLFDSIIVGDVSNPTKKISRIDVFSS